MSSLMELREEYLDDKKPKVPISVLSGFLGAGKTTLLRQVLENKGGFKVGVVVNDMAAVNIDSKLVKSDSITGGKSEIGGELVDTSEVMELQNGCACCTASDELAESLLQLLAVAAQKGEMYDRIVIETSGVSEPKAIRRQFFDLMIGGHPIFDFCDLQNMVTVVDSGNFLPLYETSQELFEKPELIEGDDMMIDVATRQVVDLLTDQVETADYVLLNKKDKVGGETMAKLTSIVKAMNPTAEVIECEHGKVDLKVVLGNDRETWIAHGDDEDDFRMALNAVKKESAASCEDPECTDPSHAHSHAHSHSADCKDEDCKDESHDHAHSHSAECKDEDCTDASHTHAHSHDAECKDEACTDESHGHSHSHSETKAAPANSPQAKFGISSFVYSRRKPFDTERLKRCILELPITANSEVGSEWHIPVQEAKLEGKSAMQAVIRSKGFVWLNNNHRKPLYWSHAGQYFDLKDFGMFWASTPLDWWPQDEQSLKQIISDFGGADNEWGDRRQEIVFIGVGMNQKEIVQRLDACLLTDKEMEEYQLLSTQQPDATKVDFDSAPPKPVDLRQPLQVE